jgi:TRAP transporter 4TM/12TM fusion protein
MIDPLTPWELFAGAAGILLVLELIRRTVGWVLCGVAAASLAYCFLGPYMPHVLAHTGFTWKQVVDYQSFGLEGIYSSAIGGSATYIVVFIIFGTFLERCGAGAGMMDLGRALAGRYRGGPAKIAVVTSAFFGTISGSAAANVYATGTFTIPLMKRTGYPAAFAGAVEAAASTGGQLMPPIMGAAAFLMADILGFPTSGSASPPSSRR